MIDNLLLGLEHILQWQILLTILLGAVVGYIIGIIPGLSAGMGIALMLPFTFGLDVLTALVFLTALYCAAEYGGSITAITLNIPGDAGSAATTLDGYPMAKQGYPAKALGISMVASFFGSLLSIFGLTFLSTYMASFALGFGPPEYFAMALFGLSLVVSLGGTSLIKGFIAVGFGLLITTIGIDPITGETRYAYSINLLEGLDIIPIILGVFAISEILIIIERLGEDKTLGSKSSGALPSLKELYKTRIATLRGALIGFAIGVIPGVGKNVASFVAYGEQKRSSKNPEKYGKGAPEGIAASESANSAVVGGALVPLLSLGIPGSIAAAILIGAFTIQGLQPGPLLFDNDPGLIYGIFIALFLGNFFMLLVGVLGIPLWTRITAFPKELFTPVVLSMVILAAFASTMNTFFMWITLIFGVIGYFMRKYNFPIAPLVLAVVLGEMIETSFRQSMLLSGGSLQIFIERPITLTIFILLFISVGFQMFRSFNKS